MMSMLPFLPSAAYAEGRGAGLGTVLDGPLAGRSVAWRDGRGLPGELTDEDFAALGTDLGRVRAAVDAQVATGHSATVELECGPRTVRLFVESALPAPRLLLF